MLNPLVVRRARQHHLPPTAQIELIRYSIAAGQCHSAGAYGRGVFVIRRAGRAAGGGHRFRARRGWRRLGVTCGV